MRASLFSMAAPLLAAASLLQADVRLPKMLSSHMVLQRDRPVHIWGWADPAEPVAVMMDGKTASANADKMGKWSVYLTPHAAGGPYSISVKGKNSVELEDVLLGDVWFASGQSNMEMPLKGFTGDGQIKNSQAEIQAANQPKMRLLRIQKNSSPFPLNDYADSWTQCTPETAADFSAAAYFFGREIATKENVPVGLIDSTWGGTPAEAWTSFEGLSSDASLMPVFSSWAEMVNGEADAALRRAMEKREDEAAAQAHQPKPQRQWRPALESWAPAGLYNAMVAPAIEYPIRGAIWYQGESNAGVPRAGLYEKLFSAMITDWRAHWGEGDLPFLFVQISSYTNNGQWPTLREAQRRTLKLINTGMAVTIDIGEPNNIHPGDKQTVGQRLALAARHIAYHEDVEFSGPVFREATPEGSQLRVYFTHADGLMAKGGAPTSFEVAGADHKYASAAGRLEGQTIVLECPNVPAPRYVRYGWKDVPATNVYNAAGLPASPFSSEESLPVGN